MRTVFLVDDDLIMLQHIRGLINWQSHGYEVAGQAMDGASAVEHILRCKPFLVLLDVELPVMDGITVLRKIRAGSPHTQVIMLSNHDTFSYVRPALKLGAVDYLLKQEITDDMLREKLMDLPAPDESETEPHALTAMRRRQHQLLECLSGRPEGEVEKLGSGQLLVFEIDQFELLGLFHAYQDLNKLIASVENTTHTLLAAAANGVAVHLSGGMFAVLIMTPEEVSQQKLAETAQHITLLLRNNLKRLLQISITVAASSGRVRPTKLHAVFLQMQAASFPAALPLPSLEMEQQLATALRFCDRDKLKMLLNQHFHFCQGSQARQAVPAVTALMRIGQRFCQDQSLCLPEEATNRILTFLRTHITLEQLIELITEFFELICHAWLGDAVQSASPHIMHAIEYIHQNYAQDISLVTAAQMLHVSSEHLARLFKKETGISFSQYVNQHRIRLAQHLMKEQHLKAADVYEQVGFRSLNYFMRAYKKNVGQTIGQSLSEERSDPKFD